MSLIENSQTHYFSLLQTKHFREAFEYINNLANQEISWAQYELGNLYSQGFGVEKNEVMAAFYYGEAADFGNYAPAQYKIGQVFLHGNGLPQNLNQSARYYAKAAAQGYEDSKNIFYKVLDLINSNRTEDSAFLKSWFEKTDNKKSIFWSNLARQCGLSHNCIKGLAFILGCKKHFSGKNPDEAKNNLDLFFPFPSPDEMAKHFNYIGSDQAIHFVFEEFAYKVGLELDPNRLNINGKKAQLFAPKDYGLLGSFPALENYYTNLKDSHHFYEQMLEKIGSYLLEDDYFVQNSYLQSCSYINTAFQEDAVAINEIVRVLDVLMPPIFSNLISIDFSEKELQPDYQGGTTAFQIAYRSLLDPKYTDNCELLWGCQRFAYYDQTTLELKNVESIMYEADKFYDFVKKIATEYASEKIVNTISKSLIDQSFILSDSEITIDQFIWKKVYQLSKFEAHDKLSPSARLQMNACVFKVIFSTLIKNHTWDNKELGEMRALDENGIIWECPEVENVAEFAMAIAPSISSWTTSNQVVIYTSKNQSIKIYVSDLTEEMDDFYKIVTDGIKNHMPDELVIFISTDADVFNDSTAIPKNSMKAFFGYFHLTGEPLLTIFICGERNSDRLVYQHHVETTSLNESGFLEAFTDNPAVQEFLSQPK
jgi:hypothetical protein